MRTTTGTPGGIEIICYTLEKAGWTVELFEILCMENCECYLHQFDGKLTLYVYTTAWEYEEPETIESNDSLLQFVRDLVSSSYSGIEDCIPEEYRKFLN